MEHLSLLSPKRGSPILESQLCLIFLSKPRPFLIKSFGTVLQFFKKIIFFSCFQFKRQHLRANLQSANCSTTEVVEIKHLCLLSSILKGWRLPQEFQNFIGLMCNWISPGILAICKLENSLLPISPLTPIPSLIYSLKVSLLLL